MQFVAASVSLKASNGAFDETWRCPEGRWWFDRTIPAPRLVDVRWPAPRARRRRPRRTHG
jgi:hypothetical protein